MSVDLTDLSNMYLLTYTSETYKGLNLWYETEKNGIKLKIYQSKKTLIVSYSPFNCDQLTHHLYNGGLIVWKQDTIDIDIGAVNRFFYETSLSLASDILPNIKKFFKKHQAKLIISGMSLGGALGQSFYLHFRRLVGDYPTIIHSFGSPRVGDMKLSDWFICQKNLQISNYALFELDSDNIKRIDPVCLFPSRRYGNYVNNPNLKMLFRKKIIDQADYYIDQPDTEITPLSLCCNFGLDKRTCELWEAIHDTDLYLDCVPGK